MKKLKPIRIIKKEKRNVYDIEMPSNHNFILANGAIAHNCSHSVSYSFISYACMYLKHHYPLEWWAAVLTNADEREITEKLFKHTKDIVLAPDINLSTDEVVVDYENKKLRLKLGVLKGLGSKAEPIVKGRPYNDIEDFIRKNVCTPSLTKKLIFVGVMDSLFPSNYTTLQKMQAYEDAVEKIDFEKKVAKGTRGAVAPKKGVIDDAYFGLHPIEEFKLKKSILPTMPLDLTSTFVQSGILLNEGTAKVPRYSDNTYDTKILLNGEQLSALDSKYLDDRFRFCAVGYILDIKEKEFSKGTKKRLICLIDVDGFVFEKVLWPNYDTGQLIYPQELGKKSVALFFMQKREGDQPSSIYSIKFVK